MYEWNEAVQKMIDWIEGHLDENPILPAMARQVGYSPYYCSGQFRRMVGKTVKSYVAQRRLTRAAEEIRDTDGRIIDIAVKYGYSSQQALQRAFAERYGCTPAAYRSAPRPMGFTVKKEVLFPEHIIREEESIMSKTILTDPYIRVEYIPAHRYIAIWDENVQRYCDFWEGHDCDTVTGIVESMEHAAFPGLPVHTGGYFWKDGKKGYSYGVGVPAEYAGEVPGGFEIREYPGSWYLVFTHPPFDFLQDCDAVVTAVEELAWGYDPAAQGFAWNEAECQDYQRMLPETLGYEVLRPVKKL